MEKQSDAVKVVPVQSVPERKKVEEPDGESREHNAPAPEEKIVTPTGTWMDMTGPDPEDFVHTDTGKAVTRAELTRMEKSGGEKIIYPGETKTEVHLPMQITFEKLPVFRCGMLDPTSVYLLTKYHAGDGISEFTELRLVPSSTFSGSISLNCNLLERALLHHISQDRDQDIALVNDIPIEPDDRLMRFDSHHLAPISGKEFGYLPDGYFMKVRNARISIRGMGMEIKR